MSFVFREMAVKQGLEEDRLQLQNTIETSLSQLQQKEGELSNWRVKVGYCVIFNPDGNQYFIIVSVESIL